MSHLSFEELRLNGVSRSFDNSVALSDLSLTIRRGEFVALLGPSGCGKSTALNCLAGLLPLTSGSITLDDHRVDVLLPEKRDFGMVFQNYALFPHLSVKRNIAFGLKIRKIAKDEIERRVDAVLSLVQLAEHKSKHPAQLSGGQQQRVAIARAVVLEPQVVLMDEPLSNLDAKLRHEMRTEIKRLHNTLGLTTVYVTHDQEEALSLADRLVVLNSGKVQQIGTPEEVYLRPINAFVADFMGYRNLLTMRLESKDTVGKYELFHPEFKLTAASISPGVQSGSVLVAIRPDEFETQNVKHNPIHGVVRSVEYQGKDFALEVEIGSDVQLHVRTFQKYELGDSITVGINPERVLVFPPKEELA